MPTTSFPRGRIRITLLENIHPSAAETLRERGYAVEVIPRAIEGDELRAVMESSHVLGVRSRTKVREEHLEHARRMLAIGCLSVGTDQVSIQDAARRGIPVFNAPHASTRSVAELTIGAVIALARRLGDKSSALHASRWDKSLAGAHEVRGRSIGIVGYGHIGQQVGLLAEAFGMRVLFHDVVKKLPLGLARPMAALDALLEEADFVTLHVPETPRTVALIGQRAAGAHAPGQLPAEPVARQGRRTPRRSREALAQRPPRRRGARRVPEGADAHGDRVRRRLRRPAQRRSSLRTSAATPRRRSAASASRWRTRSASSSTAAPPRGR